MAMCSWVEDCLRVLGLLCLVRLFLLLPDSARHRVDAGILANSSPEHSLPWMLDDVMLEAMMSYDQDRKDGDRFRWDQRPKVVDLADGLEVSNRQAMDC